MGTAGCSAWWSREARASAPRISSATDALSEGALCSAVQCNLSGHDARMVGCCKAARYKIRVRAANGEQPRPLRLRLGGPLRSKRNACKLQRYEAESNPQTADGIRLVDRLAGLNQPGSAPRGHHGAMGSWSSDAAFGAYVAMALEAGRRAAGRARRPVGRAGCPMALSTRARRVAHAGVR